MTYAVAKAAGCASALGLAFAAGAYLNRPKPCPAEKVTSHAETSQAAASVVKADVKDLVEVKPKVVTVTRTIRLPGAGCPTGIEETRTETADSRITQEAVKEASQTMWRTEIHDVQVVREAANVPGWTVGLLGGAQVSSLLRADRSWFVGAQVTHKLFWGIYAGVQAEYRPDRGLDVGLLVMKGFGK